MQSVNLHQLGQRIRQARERLSLSQEQLAELVNKDQTAVSEYENGKRKVSITELPLLANVLDVPIGYFFGEDITPDDLDQLLLKEFHRLPEQFRPDAIEAMRILVKIAKDNRA